MKTKGLTPDMVVIHMPEGKVLCGECSHYLVYSCTDDGTPIALHAPERGSDCSKKQIKYVLPKYTALKELRWGKRKR